MARKKDLQDEATWAYLHFLARRTPLLGKPSARKNIATDPGGSGTFLRLEDRVFVVTAKHVIDDLDLTKGVVLVEANERKTGPRAAALRPVLNRYPHPHRDVALLELSPEVPNEFGYETMSIETIDFEYKPGERDLILWCGYPKKLQDPGKEEISKIVFTLEATEPVDWETERENIEKRFRLTTGALNSDYELFLFRSPDALQVVASRGIQMPKPQFPAGGMSGGGMWRAATKMSELKDKVFSPTALRYVGTEQSVFPKVKAADGDDWVRGTRARAIQEIIDTQL